MKYEEIICRIEKIYNDDSKTLEEKKILSKEQIEKINPWNGFKFPEHAEKDLLLALRGEGNLDVLKWNKIHIDSDKYQVEDQIPLPINGNFFEAEYILLYSNPATEDKKFREHSIESLKTGKADMLLKCFTFDKDAELVVNFNESWQKWYKKELGRFCSTKDFYIPVKSKEKNISLVEEKEFLKKFCFINFCAYATGTNSFDVSTKEIYKFESTKFAIALVHIAKIMKKEIFVMRIRDDVWKKRVFKELGAVTGSVFDTRIFDKKDKF